MDVALVGNGPAAAAVESAVRDSPAELFKGKLDDLAGADLGIVVARTQSNTLSRVSEAVGPIPWIAIELGGIGGYSFDTVDASVAGFSEATGCYDCLRMRVAANSEPTSEHDECSANAARLAGAVGGWAAVRAIAGDDWLAGRVVELPYIEREFLPVPTCEQCREDHDPTLNLTHRPRELDTVLEEAERIVDDRVGLLSDVGEIDSYPAPYYLASVANTSGFSDVTAASQAAGVAVEWNLAFVKAIGEGLERYCAGVYRDQFNRGPPAAINDGVSPSSFVSGEHTTEAIPWVLGRELMGPPGGDQTTAESTVDDQTNDGATKETRDPIMSKELVGKRVWLPAEFIYFPPPERRFDAAITTGLGLGSGSVDALLSGLYEVVERDATMLSWYSTSDPLGLSVKDEEFESLVGRARGVNLDVTPMLVTMDIDVPVVTVAVHREEEWPKFAVGSAANLDPVEAARSALAESLQNWMELRRMGPEQAAGERGAIGKYATFPQTVREFIAIDDHVPIDSVSTGESYEGLVELGALVERIRSVGLRPFGARLTTADVAKLGFEAVRAVVPSAQPLFTDEPTFGSRGREVPSAMGFESRLDRELHPYP